MSDEPQRGSRVRGRVDDRDIFARVVRHVHQPCLGGCRNEHHPKACAKRNSQPPDPTHNQPPSLGSAGVGNQPKVSLSTSSGDRIRRPPALACRAETPRSPRRARRLVAGEARASGSMKSPAGAGTRRRVGAGSEPRGGVIRSMTRRDDASLAIDSIVLAAELLERATRRNTSPPWGDVRTFHRGAITSTIVARPEL